MTITQDNCPLVLVRWLDSRQPIPSWRLLLSDIERSRPVECATVGWLIEDTAEVKTVCQSVGDICDPNNAQASGVMTIPARCVISVERLVEEDQTTSALPVSCLAPATQPKGAFTIPSRGSITPASDDAKPCPKE